MRKRRELKLASTMESLRSIEEFSERVSDEYFLNDSYFGNIITCLTEAVRNAIVHGNELKDDKIVTVILEDKEEGLLFTVRDQGKGFDYNARIEGENTEDKGKGLIIIRSLTDDMIIWDEGRAISMLFRISGIDAKVSESRALLLLKYQQTHGKFAKRVSD